MSQFAFGQDLVKREDRVMRMMVMMMMMMTMVMMTVDFCLFVGFFFIDCGI